MARKTASAPSTIAIAQPSFTTGELTPSLHGRVDLARYYTALKTCRNCIARPYGGVTNRAGTRMLAEVKDSTRLARLIDFQFSTEQAYTLEFSHFLLRIYRDGGLVVYPPGDPSAGLPVEVVTPWPESVLFRLKVTQSADVMTICHPSYRQRQLTRTSHYAWTLTEFDNVGGPFVEVNTSEAQTIFASAATGAITLTGNAVIWDANDVGRLFYIEQMPDHTTSRWEVQKTVYAGYTRRAGGSYYRAATSGTTGTVRPSTLEGREADGDPGVIWEFLHQGFGIVRIDALVAGVSKNITAAVSSGGLIKLTATAHGLNTGELVTVAGVTGTTEANGTWVVTRVDANNVTLQGSAFANAYVSGGTIILTAGSKISATVQSRLPDGVTLPPVLARTITNVADSGAGLIRVTSNNHGFSTGMTVAVAGVVAVRDDPIGGDPPPPPIPWTEMNSSWIITVVDANNFDLQGSTVPAGGTYTSGGTATNVNLGQTTYKWAIEAWGGEQGYPSATAYHNQRQVFGATTAKPQTVWESTVAGYSDFSQSIPLLDDEAISFELVSRRMNEIRHFVEIGELIALTSDGPWLIKKDQGSPIPTVKQQGRGGASHVPPVVIGQWALYVLEKGGGVRSLSYFFESDRFDGRDLTITGSHLLQGRTIVDWAYQEVPFACVWAVLDNGSLLGLTYMPEQDVVGWHRHDTVGGLVESVCCIPEGNEDALYLVVKRGAKRYVERMESRFFDDARDAFFVDCGLTYDGRTAGDGVHFTLTTAGGWTYQDLLTFTTTTNFFVGASDVGDAVVLTAADGVDVRLRIMQYVSATEVKVMASRTVPVEFRAVDTVGFAMARNTISGIPHEGQEVAILADGNAPPRQTVTAGAITLQQPAVVVHVGLPITADVETLNLNIQGQSIQEKEKNVGAVTFLVEGTRGLQAGPNADNLLEFPIESTGYYGDAVDTLEGVVQTTIPSTWSKGGNVFIRQTEPLPFTILSATPQAVISGP